MSTTNGEAGPSVAHEIRITSHGKIKNWVTFALAHFQKYEDRPLVLHTLPASKGKAPSGESEKQQGATPHPAESENPDCVEKGAKDNRLHTSMANIPRLVSVVEIIKREYVKTLDSALAQAGSLSGLHQYNEIGDLEEHGLVEGTGNEEQDRIQSLAHALQGRNHLKQKKIAFMRVSLCRKEVPELVRKGATCVCLGFSAAAPSTEPCCRYQQPAVRKLSKSTRARLKKRLRKADCGS
ncbi:hypothetical protein LXA43DRAFT_927060 [Ganoderma leucocontextum]|nr:hypothetical protein LXA43DRAFT_927060 [Ganoderma leucocontextum]